MKVVLAVGAGIVIGGTAMWLVMGNNNGQGVVQANDHPLLAQRISIENPNDTIINFSGLRKSLNNFYNEQQRVAGIYFEYLPTGTSIRINASQEFRPASLMKLPVAMEFYHGVELGKIDPQKKVALKEEWLNDEFGELYQKGAGYEISYEEAARIMLVDSDNTALRAVLEATQDSLGEEDRALGALDIEFSRDISGEITVGARAYASFLKCLYFACFNSREHSQLMLEHLTQTPYNNRLIGGIPTDDNVKVAHKIGVFNTRVQSDCGIVYLEKRNYVLCVMVTGDRDESTDNYFKQASSLVYDFVKNYEL